MEPDDFEKSGGRVWGFVAFDDQTKTLREIQWARILVKTRGDECVGNRSGGGRLFPIALVGV